MIDRLINQFGYATFSNLQAARAADVGENALFDLAKQGKIRLVDNDTKHNLSRWRVMG